VATTTPSSLEIAQAQIGAIALANGAFAAAHPVDVDDQGRTVGLF
jgi:hypothetical protein